MSHSHSLDFNEVMCTENKEKEQKMNEREREREEEGGKLIKYMTSLLLHKNCIQN